MKKTVLIIFIFSFLAGCKNPNQPEKEYLNISGVYPHLAVFNEGDGILCGSNGNETGIGAIVPWAGKLWMVTYSPHCPNGSSDKLYSIDKDLNVTIHPESVGGTPANRMIHKPSQQLLIGPYLIDTAANVRVIHPDVMPGRLTATTRHLDKPESMVYYYDMEGMLYEANVYDLSVTKLFHKPVPGWHGKGAYTTQGRLIIANNGEHKVFDIEKGFLQAGGPPQNVEEMGVLAEWDGDTWNIVERKQFTDVTGPGNIYGYEDPEEVAWSIGWDRRSVILKLLEQGSWYTFRLPKATHTYDHWGGWYTEWPRIRDIGNDKMLMDMHGMFYDFPESFSIKNSSGLIPIANHLRYVPDFCNWNGQLVLATDETSILKNPYAGRAQSNLWFGKYEDLFKWGAENGWGGVWLRDAVEANEPSDPYLFRGLYRKLVHLYHDAIDTVQFTFETDVQGNGEWSEVHKETVHPGEYSFHVFPSYVEGQWIRVTTDKACTATAFFHYLAKSRHTENQKEIFQALADVDYQPNVHSGWIRPSGYNKNLQFIDISGKKTRRYLEVDENIKFISDTEENKLTTAVEILEIKKDISINKSSVVVQDETGTYLLPKTDPTYDSPFVQGWPRGIREVESERYMLNAHGTFYEFPREAGLEALRPIATHKKQILDYCTWRGLLVLTGTKKDARPDGNYFRSDSLNTGLWFGAIDDIWKFGKPTGQGGPWKETKVAADEPSLPYLMTNYDIKTMKLLADEDVIMTVEVNVDHTGWQVYDQFQLEKGVVLNHQFPDGYAAHWVRVIAEKECIATAWFIYE